MTDPKNMPFTESPRRRLVAECAKQLTAEDLAYLRRTFLTLVDRAESHMELDNLEKLLDIVKAAQAEQAAS